MSFRGHDYIRVFLSVARNGSLTAAAEQLNMTKGAVGYQIKSLEHELGFPVFDRSPRGMALTAKGATLWQSANTAYRELERTIDTLRDRQVSVVTLGLSTYLASRWLSPRLTDFMTSHPNLRLRLQPLVDLLDLEREGIDMAIRWGDGSWTDLTVELLFPCPAFPTGPSETADRIARLGLEAAWADASLLDDRQGSRAWADWHKAAGLNFPTGEERLVIPDPNVRVQAVIDGQGIALNDMFVEPELNQGRMVRLTDTALDSYGYYLVYPEGALDTPSVRALRNWLHGVATRPGS